MLQEKESLVQNLEELSDDSNSPLVYHQKSNNSNSHPTPYNVIDGDNPQITTGVANDHHRDESIPIQVEQKDVSILEKDYRVAGPVKIKETNSEGILKRSRSYENLRNSERRVNFDDDIAPGVYDSSSTSSSDVEETGLEDGAGDIGNISESTAKVNINSTVEENTAKFTKTEDQTYGMISDTAKHNLAKTKTKKITAYDNPIYMERGCEILQNHTNDSSLNINTPEITPSAKNVRNTDDGWRDENEANKNVSSYDEIDIVHALVRCQPSQTQNSDISQSGSQVSQPGSHISKSQVSQPNRNVILEKNSSHDTIKQNIKSQSIKPEPKETTDTLTNSMDDIRHNHNEDSRDVFLSSSSSEVLNSRSAKVETVSGQLAFVNSLDCFEDLTDCSAEDINFLSRLTKAQIVCRVCSLALQDEDRRAYSILDQPLRDVLEQEHLSKVLQQFVAKQYKSEHTLMDLDPSTAISLIDAVRYRSQVAPDVVQNTLVGVVRNINDHLRPCCLHLALAFFNNIFNDFSLKTIVSDPNFCAKCLHYLENAVGTLQDRSGSDSVIGKLRNIMGFIK